MGVKTTVYDIQLKTVTIIEELKKVVDAMAKVRKEFAKSITLTVDTSAAVKALEALRQEATSNTDRTVSAINSVRDAILSLAGQARTAGPAIAEALTKNVATAAAAVKREVNEASEAMTLLEAKAISLSRSFETRRSRLTPDSRSQFDQLTGPIAPGRFIGTFGSGKEQFEAIDPRQVQEVRDAFTRVTKGADTVASAEAKLAAELERDQKQLALAQQRAVLASQTTNARIAKLREDPGFRTTPEHFLTAEAEFDPQAMASIRALLKMREAQEKLLIQQGDAQAREDKKVTDAKAALAAEVDRTHDQANALRLKERIDTEKAHDRATKLLNKEADDRAKEAQADILSMRKARLAAEIANERAAKLRTNLPVNPITPGDFLSKEGRFDTQTGREVNAQLKRMEVAERDAAVQIEAVAKNNKDSANAAQVFATAQRKAAEQLDKLRATAARSLSLGQQGAFRQTAGQVAGRSGTLGFPMAVQGLAGQVDAAKELNAQRTREIAANDAAEKRAAAARAKSLKDQGQLNDAANRHLKIQQGIGLSIAETAVRLGKWLVFYRLVHDVTRTIENVLRSFVQEGLEFTKQLETQQLALRGILAENFEIRDNQGKLITGAVAMDILQRQSAKQWQEISAASLSVVGTTSDLMGLYEGILPFAARLGKNLEDVQQLTKATAISASLLDVSFQDARSAMVAVLQGRGLTRNRLTGALGITPEETKALKGTPQLFDLIMAKMDQFLAMNKEAQQTFAAMSESLKDFSGRIGASFVQPFIDALRKLVNYLTKNLFDAVENGSLRLKTTVQNTLNLITTALRNAVKPVEDFGRTLTGQTDEVLSMVVGVSELVRQFLTLMITLGQLAMKVSTFIATNRSLLTFFAYLTLGASAVNIVLFKIPRALLAASENATLFGAALRSLTGALGGTAAATETVAGATAKASLAVRLFKVEWATLLATIGAGAIISIAVVGIGLLTQRLARLRDETQSLNDMMNHIRQGQFSQARLDAEQRLKSPELLTSVRAASDIATNATTAGQRATERGRIQDTKDAIKFQEDYIAKLKEQEVVLDRLAKLKAANKNTLTEEQKVQQAAAIDRIQQIRDEHETLVRSITDAQGLLSDLPLVQTKAEEAHQQLLKLAKDFAELDKLRNQEFAAARRPGLLKEMQDLSFQYHGLLKAVDSIIAEQKRLSGIGAALVTTPGGENFIPIQKDIVPKVKLDMLGDAPAQIEAINKAMDKQLEAEKTRRDTGLATAMDYAAAINKIEFEREKELQAVRQEGLTNITAYFKNKEKAEVDDKQVEATTITEWEQRINGLISDAQKRRTEATKDGLVKTQEEIEKEADLFDSGMGRLASIFGVADERVEIELGKLQRAIQEFELTTGKSLQEALGISKEAFGKFIGAAVERVRLVKELEDLARTGQRLGDQQNILREMFDLGRISVGKYVSELNRLEAAQRKNLLSQRDNIIRQMASQLAVGTVAPQFFNRDKFEDLAAQLATIEASLQRMPTAVDKTKTAFDELGKAISGIGQLLHILDGFNEKFGEIGDAINDAINNARAFIELVNQMRKAVAALQAVQTAGKVTGSLTGTAAGGVTTGGTAAVAGGSSTALIATGYGAVAVAVIAFMAHEFAVAVKAAEKEMTDAMKRVSDSIADGTTEIGEGLAQLKNARAQYIMSLSTSKEGRKALKEILPQFDDMIKELETRIKDIRAAFQEKLTLARAGSGPFADFFAMLLDLQKTTREYLDTFDKSSKDYADALKNVTELFNLTLKDAKNKLEEQFLGFGAEGIQSAMRVLDLIQEQADLYEQMADLETQRQEALDEQSHLAEQKQKEIDDLIKEREDRTKQILELEKQIADVIKKAAEDEAAIRRRGVLEAQETIAQQKAREIADVRRQKLEDIDKLRQQIKDLQAQDNFDEKLKDINDKYDKQGAALAKQLASIDKQNAKLQEQIKINAIRLDVARQIAAIEGEVVDNVGDRYELEFKSGQIQIQQAKLRAQQWKETRDLIDSIIDNGDGIIFNPPPGFPQFKVTIGNIYIDNSGTVVNNGTGEMTPGGGAPGPENPRKPDDPDRPDKGGPGGPDKGLAPSTNSISLAASMTLAERQGYGSLRRR